MMLAPRGWGGWWLLVMATHTFLCTDIDGSTSMLVRLGDAYWAGRARGPRWLR
jgi:hypothetical protein